MTPPLVALGGTPARRMGSPSRAARPSGVLYNRQCAWPADQWTLWGRSFEFKVLLWGLGFVDEGSGAKGIWILALVSLLFTCFSISAADKAADAAPPTDAFGESVAISGSTIVISDENHNGKGYAYVFTRDGASWRPATQESGLNGFAWNVVSSGSSFAVGTLYGRAYVYAAGVKGWQRTADLKSPYKGDKSYFGDPIAFSGTTLLVAGQPNDESSSASQIFVFTDGIRVGQDRGAASA